MNVKQERFSLPVHIGVKNMMLQLSSVLFILLFSFPMFSLASGNWSEDIKVSQQTGKTITGRITDQNGESMIGVNVVESGTTNGTVTDVDGNYSLQLTT